MAVTRSTTGGVIKMTAASDSISDSIFIQGVQLQHSAAANAALTIGGMAGAISLAVTTSVLADRIMFPKPIKANGVTVGTLSAGTILIYTA